MKEQVIIRPLLVTVFGLIVWAAHFAVIYGFNALACELGLDRQSAFGLTTVPLTISIVTTVALIVLAIFALSVWKSGSRLEGQQGQTPYFLNRVTITVVAISALAIIFDTIPVYLVGACA